MNIEPASHWFEPQEEALAYLAQRDPVLGNYIAARGRVRRRIYPEPFSALLRCVIGQQISARAQESVWQKFAQAFGELSAAELASLAPEAIRSCGISLRKARYLQGIAAQFASGELEAGSLAAMSDAELAGKLTKLPGVGNWTVEMLLIFTFQRPDVLSFGDLAIRRGLCLLHGHKALTRELFAHYYQLYSPHATVAGFYLWDLAGQKN